MITYLIGGLIIGFAGSLHCAGMCGPLQLLVPSRVKGQAPGTIEFIFYHIGRVTLYSLLGVLSGLIGLQLMLFQSFQWISIILGSIMLVFAWVGLEHNGKLSQRVMALLQGRLQKVYYALRVNPSLLLIFNIGLLNGLLPCGLVYFALLNAIASQHIGIGFASMAMFGLGTLPIFIFLKVVRSKVKNQPILTQLQPYILTVAALLIILRGLNLGIAYLSPTIEKASKYGAPSVKCCKNSVYKVKKKAD
jgi:sulfite exporter TauE/SafE